MYQNVSTYPIVVELILFIKFIRHKLGTIIHILEIIQGIVISGTFDEFTHHPSLIG
jgi:hypothetical protein